MLYYPRYRLPPVPEDLLLLCARAEAALAGLDPAYTALVCRRRSRSLPARR